MAITRQLIKDIRALDAYDLRRLQIVVRGLLLDDERSDEIAARAPRVTYRQQTVRCGKKGCSTCPHGPYWYAYWREDGRMKSKYIGKELPAG
jgi:hypothetical protein